MSTLVTVFEVMINKTKIWHTYRDKKKRIYKNENNSFLKDPVFDDDFTLRSKRKVFFTI